MCAGFVCLQDKSTVSQIFQQFNMIDTQFQKVIQILQTDNNKKYVNSSISSFLWEKDVIHQTPCADTS